jgi:hypothetical protein
MPTRIPHKVNLHAGAAVTLTNQVAGLTEFAGTADRRTRVDLTDCDKVRLTGRVNVAGATGAVLRVQYSTDDTNWNTLTGDLPLDGAIGTKATAWAATPAGAKGDVILRVVAVGGNGTADPVIGNLMLEAA